MFCGVGLSLRGMSAEPPTPIFLYRTQTFALDMKVARLTAADAPPSPGGAERLAASADLYGTFSRWHGTPPYR
jgi:hypothetical protein